MTATESLNGRRVLLVKAGTDTVTLPDGSLDTEVIAARVDEMMDICRTEQYFPIFITSGAVAKGRRALGAIKSNDETVRRQQAFSSIGQYRLMMAYNEALQKHRWVAGQLVLTRREIDNPTEAQSITGTMEELWGLNAMPVLNANDPVNTKELRITDNDELCKHIALLTRAPLVFLLTSKNGLQTDVNDHTTRVPYVDPRTDEWKRHIDPNAKSEGGTGGGETKFSVAADVAQQLEERVYVGNGKEIDALHRMLRGEIGTLFSVHRPEGDANAAA